MRHTARRTSPRVGGRPMASAVLAGLISLAPLAVTARAMAGVPPVPIPEGPDQGSVPQFVGHPATPKPISAGSIPQHPHMATNGKSNIHADAYMTDSYTWGGPLGKDVQVSSTFQSADCASLTFDSAGRLVTICVGLEGPRLMMFDPASLETLGQLSLPPRDPACGSSVFTDFSGGGYFYL